MQMEKLCDLIKDLRKRSRGFKEASDNCHVPADKLALHARADEAEQCAIALEMTLQTIHSADTTGGDR